MLFKILTVILLLGLLVLSPAVCVFVCVGMLPALVARMVDIRPGKNTSATVTFFNLAGITIPVMKFLHGDIQVRTVVGALDLKLLSGAYLFAAMGYFIVWLVPKVTVIVVDYRNERRAIKIRERIAELVEEWGPEVKSAR